jgi:hypothetical protein
MRFVAFCFSFNVLASTGTVHELERVVDDYHNSPSVDWDQKDPALYEANWNGGRHLDRRDRAPRRGRRRVLDLVRGNARVRPLRGPVRLQYLQQLFRRLLFCRLQRSRIVVLLRHGHHDLRLPGRLHAVREEIDSAFRAARSGRPFFGQTPAPELLRPPLPRYNDPNRRGFLNRFHRQSSGR